MPLIDHSISISTSHDTPLRPGGEIAVVATIDISHPAGYTPTETYTWTDENGTVLSNDQNPVISFSRDGYNSFQIEVFYQDTDNAYERTIIQDATVFVEDYVEGTLEASFRYNQELFKEQYSNMDIYRILSTHPKWSAAHNNFYSNASKLLSPLLEPISNALDELDTMIENSYGETNHFGYRDGQYSIKTITPPSLIKTEYGYCNNVGLAISTSLESRPIKHLSEREAHGFKKEVILNFSNDDVLSLPNESEVYVCSNNANSDNILRVYIEGISEQGNTVSEVVYLFSNNLFETLNRYMAIYKVDCDETIDVYTYLDPSEHHTFENGVNLQKRICGIGGEYFEPGFDIDSGTLRVLDSNSVSKMEHFKFSLPNLTSKVFVNNLLDILYLDGSDLYAGKLMLDYYSINQVDPNVNNNKFIEVEDENFNPGDEIRAIIYCDNIKETLRSNLIRVSISNDGEKMYLSRDMSLTSDKNTWLDITNSSNYITLDLTSTNDSPYIFSIETMDLSSQYSAMAYVNSILGFKLRSNVADFFIYNRELYIEDLNGSFSVADPVRMCFTYDKDSVYLFSDFEKLDLIYKND